jgi:hypothetical protein
MSTDRIPRVIFGWKLPIKQLIELCNHKDVEYHLEECYDTLSNRKLLPKAVVDDYGGSFFKDVKIDLNYAEYGLQEYFMKNELRLIAESFEDNIIIGINVEELELDQIIIGEDETNFVKTQLKIEHNPQFQSLIILK